ncbi:MAG TPA: ribosomal L7Ae/L30e/S12e/Gadd45 family protein [Gemmatimonadaceae bacterium]|nr:ribosomal L7Ae/L30e/S12e/Gadd45 family protein [Gemmatimonadaceae bacterium]
MDAGVERRLLGLLGLGVRARTVVVGVEQVRSAAHRGLLHLAVFAPDASRNSLEKVLPLLRAKRVRVIEGPSASVLGAAVGREATAAVGIVDRDLAKGVRAIAGLGPAGAP